MFKIKYYDTFNRYVGDENFSTAKDADIQLRINGFVFNKDKDAYERRLSNRFQEAIIVKL